MSTIYWFGICFQIENPKFMSEQFSFLRIVAMYYDTKLQKKYVIRFYLIRMQVDLFFTFSFPLFRAETVYDSVSGIY